jgi:hypothetical protein
MTTLPLLQSLKESILSQASVKAIYGEPISAHGKTIVPVARIMYGYDAGREQVLWAIAVLGAKEAVAGGIDPDSGSTTNGLRKCGCRRWRPFPAVRNTIAGGTVSFELSADHESEILVSIR